MTALQHLVLESVRRLDEADSEKIREYVSQLMGHEVVDERVSSALQGLIEKELVSLSEKPSGASTVSETYSLSSGGQLFFSASKE